MGKFKFKVTLLMTCILVAAIIIPTLIFISVTFGPMLAQSWLFTQGADDSTFEILIKSVFRLFYIVGCILLFFRFASAAVANYQIFMIKLKHKSWFKKVKGMLS